MEPAEIERLAALEDRHWWYAERRHVLRRVLRDTPCDGIALDVGAAGGGNTRVLSSLGWRAVAVEYGETGAGIARARGMTVVRADAHRLPFTDGCAGLVTALDVLEHLQDDVTAAAGFRRVLRPGGRLVVAVPADPALWSAHDEAVGHLRRYTRETLRAVLAEAGLEIEQLWSWNVLLRPVVARRRQSSEGSDLSSLPRVVNAGLRGVVALERVLPLEGRPGVSLWVTARRP